MSSCRVSLSIFAATAMIVFGAVLLSRTIDDADIERRWFGVIAAEFLLPVGMYSACKFADVLRRQLGRRQRMTGH